MESARTPSSLLLCAVLCWLALAGVAQAQAQAPKFDGRVQAEMALHETIWGNDEEFTTHSRARVPPTPVDSLTGLSGPVRVEVSVMVEKAKIDTVLQVATIKWWLRQSWKDPRLAWDTTDYTYGKPESEQTGTISSTTRRPGPDGGVWIPDLVLWESHFDGTQSTAIFPEPPNVIISSDGSCFLSVPQQVKINMKPRMNLANFPFDKQNITFTLGAWSYDMSQQDIRAPGDNGTGVFDITKFMSLLGVKGHGDASSYDVKVQGSDENAGDYLGTEEWEQVDTYVIRNEDKFPCCENPYVTISGTIEFRRAPRYYLKYGVLPEILMTQVGLIAHAFRGHTASSVTFICGTGFTVILTLTAHIVFMLDRLPVVRAETFMEFVFLWSLSISLVATCFSLYLYKKTEWREEHDAAILEHARQKKFRRWEDMSESAQKAMKFWMTTDQLIFPVLGALYIMGILIRASGAGCSAITVDSKAVHSPYCMVNHLWLEIFLSIAAFIIICLAAFYDLWKSAEMSHAPHTPLKNHVKTLLAPKLGVSEPKPGSGDPRRSSTYQDSTTVDLGLLGQGPGLSGSGNNLIVASPEFTQAPAPADIGQASSGPPTVSGWQQTAA